MKKLTDYDLNFCVSRIPKDVRHLMSEYSLFIGGGFIRNTISGEKVNDIDLFGHDETNLKLAAQEIAMSRKGKIHETKYALTVICSPRIPVQFIKRWLYSDIETLCNEFDFTVCQAAIQVQSDKDDTGKIINVWSSFCSDYFYSDLAAKRLVYTSPKRDEEAGGSFLRMRKFLRRGYNIQASSMAGIVARLISKTQVRNFSDEEHVKTVITGLLREVDPLTVVDGLDLIDEHE